MFSIQRDISTCLAHYVWFLDEANLEVKMQFLLKNSFAYYVIVTSFYLGLPITWVWPTGVDSLPGKFVRNRHLGQGHIWGSLSSPRPKKPALSSFFTAFKFRSSKAKGTVSPTVCEEKLQFTVILRHLLVERQMNISWFINSGPTVGSKIIRAHEIIRVKNF